MASWSDLLTFLTFKLNQNGIWLNRNGIWLNRSGIWINRSRRVTSLQFADDESGKLDRLPASSQLVGWVERSDTHHIVANIGVVRQGDGVRKRSTHPAG